MTDDLTRCRDEQRRCAEHLLTHGHDRGAALGLSDWVQEEIEIMAGEPKPSAQPAEAMTPPPVLKALPKAWKHVE